jgi:hypothetical protein
MVEAFMRYLLLYLVFAALVCTACTKKEFYQDYAIQNTAENDDDLVDPAK